MFSHPVRKGGLEAPATYPMLVRVECASTRSDSRSAEAHVQAVLALRAFLGDPGPLAAGRFQPAAVAAIVVPSSPSAR